MHEDRYVEIENTSDYKTFTFISQGRHGDLVKIVSFGEIDEFSNVFNLALGTILPGGKMDFETVTNNGDRNKILVTVADIILKFIENHPGKNVYITGSDDRRTLLYQRAIAYGYDELIEVFNIYGDISINSRANEFELFDKTRNYAGFLVEKKTVNGE
jgi:hypothetical protein